MQNLISLSSRRKKINIVKKMVEIKYWKKYWKYFSHTSKGIEIIFLRMFENFHLQVHSKESILFCGHYFVFILFLSFYFIIRN